MHLPKSMWSLAIRIPHLHLRVRPRTRTRAIGAIQQQQAPRAMMLQLRRRRPMIASLPTCLPCRTKLRAHISLERRYPSPLRTRHLRALSMQRHRRQCRLWNAAQSWKESCQVLEVQALLHQEVHDHTRYGEPCHCGVRLSQ